MSCLGLLLQLDQAAGQCGHDLNHVLGSEPDRCCAGVTVPDADDDHPGLSVS